MGKKEQKRKDAAKEKKKALKRTEDWIEANKQGKNVVKREMLKKWKAMADDGYTIKGVQKLLRTHGPRLLVGRSEGRSLAEMDKQGQLFRDERTGGGIGDDSRSVPNRKMIEEIVSELEDLRDLLNKAL